MANVKITKQKLDALVQEYENPAFINDDPVQFPHRFKSKENIEISGFISSVFAYGNRKKIIENLNCIHQNLGKNPYEFILNFDLNRDGIFFGGFCYRFNNEEDILNLIGTLQNVLRKYGSLEKAFMRGYSDSDENVKNGLINFVKLFKENLVCGKQCTRSFSHLVPSPVNGSACKRLNMFLRWMVRKGPVDFGIWKGIPAYKLIIPLDVHVSRISRLWGLTGRSSDDWHTAEEITEKLKEFDPIDPVRYDFAIFGSGVNGVV